MLTDDTTNSRHVVRLCRTRQLTSGAVLLGSFVFPKALLMLSFCDPVHMEPFDAFCQRRHDESSALAQEMGLWSKQWATSIGSWAQHVYRAHDPLTWSKYVSSWHDSQWLDLQRILFSSRGYSRTKTRCCPGAPAKRWHDGVKSARQALASSA